MANNLVEEVTYRVSIDTQAQKQLIRGLEEIRQTEADVARQFERLGPVAAAGVRGIQTRLGGLDRTLDESRESVEDLRRELLRLDDVEVSPKVKTTGASVGQRLDTGSFGSFFSAAGGLGGQSAETLQQIGQLADTTDYILALGSAAGPAAIALGALVAAVAFFTAENEKASQGLKNFLATQAEYYQIIQNGTRDEVELAREAKADEIAILENQLAENERITRELARQYQEGPGQTLELIFGQGLADGIAGLAQLTNVGGIGDLASSTADLQKKLGEARIALARLDAGLANNVTAANDAEAAAQSQLEKTQELIGTYTTGETVGTAYEQAIAFLNDQMVAGADAANELGGTVGTALGTLFNTLAPDTRGLEAGVNTFLENVDKTREAAEKLADTTRNNLERSIKGLTESVSDSSADIVEARNEISTLQAESAARISQIRADLTAEEQRIRADANNELAQLARDHNVDLLESQQDFNTAMARLREDEATDQLNFIGDRDAEASYLSEQQAKTELRREEQDHRTEESRRRASYQRQLNDLASATNREIQLAQAGAQREIQIEQQKTAIEVQARQAGLNIMLQQYQSFLQQLTALASQATGTNIQNLLVPTSQTISNEEAFKLLGIRGYADGGVGQGIVRVNDGGGMESAYTRNRLMAFSNPTRIFSAEETAAMMGRGGSAANSFNFNPTIIGTDRRQIERTFVTLLNQALDIAEKETRR